MPKSQYKSVMVKCKNCKKEEVELLVPRGKSAAWFRNVLKNKVFCDPCFVQEEQRSLRS